MDLLISSFSNNYSKPHDRLSEREYQVLCLIASGKSINGIAEKLRLSKKTISTYRARMLQKMDMKNKDILQHPNQKPVALYKWLLKNYAKPGDKILDTHLGSGSIAIACLDMGFDLTGTELDKEYFDAMQKRIATHMAQTQLF